MKLMGKLSKCVTRVSAKADFIRVFVGKRREEEEEMKKGKTSANQRPGQSKLPLFRTAVHWSEQRHAAVGEIRKYPR
jgi:hypothetical protein